MNNMYATVLFLFVFTSTSSISCSSSKNNEEIFMVVDDQTSTMHPASIGLTKADNPVQIGRFHIGEGKLLTLSRPLDRPYCIRENQPCGALDWCCEGLTCDRFFDGRCHVDPYCKPNGAGCALLSPCCFPYECSKPVDGTCGLYSPEAKI